MKRFLVAASFAALTLSAFALPSIDAVQTEIGKGNYAHAEEMMREVVIAKPNSARARYLYAEILAHDRRFAQAAEESAQARRLDPSLSFTQSEKFNAFEQLLAREQGAGNRASPVSRADTPRFTETLPVQPAGGVPGWAWGLGGGALALLAWRTLSARRQPMAWPPAMPGSPGTLATNSPAGPGGPGGPGFSGSAPGYAPAAASGGSGLLGTGMAVAGGVAAGMLAEKLFEGHHDTGLGSGFSTGTRGLESGMFDDRSAGNAAARELEQRPIDIGSGDGWGGGDADAGSSGDGGDW